MSSATENVIFVKYVLDFSLLFAFFNQIFVKYTYLALTKMKPCEKVILENLKIYCNIWLIYCMIFCLDLKVATSIR